MFINWAVTSPGQYKLEKNEDCKEVRHANVAI